MEKKTTTDVSPESTTGDGRKTSLADVKRRLEAEKKRMANVRKSRNEAKIASPKAAKVMAPLKRKAESRRSIESEVKKKKLNSPANPSSSSNVRDTVTPKKKISPTKKSPVKTSPNPEVEKKEEDVVETKVETPEKSAEPLVEVKQAEKKEDEELEDTMPLAALRNNQKDTKAEAQSSGLPPDTEYSMGYKLEAKDFNEDWYPARVVEVDYDDREVLVHFDRWSARYDEWISMDSPRLRPPGPLSNGTKQTKAPAKQKISVPKTPQAAEPASPVIPATPDVPVVPPTTSSAPAPVRLFKVGDHVMASWSDSRKYPAKIAAILENDMYNVLFFDGFSKIIKGSRISAGLRPGTQVDPSAPVEPPLLITSVYPPEEDIGSKADRRERKRKINVCELFSMKRRTSPSSKPSTSSPSGTLTSANKTPSSPPTKLANKPAASSADAPCPPKRSKTKTPKLQSPGHEDLLLIKNMSSSPPGEANKPTTPATDSEPRRVRTLLPRAKTGTSAASDPPPPHNSCTRSSAEQAPLVPAAPAGILEGIQIEMEDGNFKCPSEGCGKLYRKENLLQMHIKHYHPELKSLLVVVPKVMELAYARTISDLPSTAVAHRNTSSSAIHSASSTSVTSAANQRKNVTPQPAPKKTPKAVEKPEIDVTVVKPSVSQPEVEAAPSIPLPLSTPAKTGQIKMLLPVNRSVVKNDGTSVDSPSTGQQPLSALQQALMSPPGALSAMLHQSPAKSAASADSHIKLPMKPDAKPVFHSPTRSRPGSPRGGRLRDEKSPNKELVNCMCGVSEEDGLMIQCDLCMCWQHGLCNMIETEEQVPEKYVCHICLHPPKERFSRKYAHDQDWLKEGILPRMPIRRNQSRVVRTNTEELLKEAHVISASITRLQDIIHSLRVKINIAEKADHPKLYLWSKQWEMDEIKPLFSKIVEEVKLVDEEMKPKPDSQASDDSDIHPALKMPLTQSELDHLASTVEHKLLSTEDGHSSTITSTPEMKAPEPEAPIQPEACRLVLLEHIEKLQAQLEARLEELEAKADEIEAKDPDLFGNDGESSPCTKETIRMLQRDLGAVTRISNYATSD